MKLIFVLLLSIFSNYAFGEDSKPSVPISKSLFRGYAKPPQRLNLNSNNHEDSGDVGTPLFITPYIEDGRLKVCYRSL